MKKSLLKEALEKSVKFLPKHPQFDYFPHFSYLVKDNQIIGAGYNCGVEPDKKFGYHGRSRDLGESFKSKQHSENSVILKTHRYIRGATMINVRLTRDGRVRMSMPCKICRNVMTVVGITKCFFTVDESSGWGVITL